MKTGYRKILRDVWGSKGRTLLMVLSLSVGVFAVGLVSGLNELMPTAMTGSFRRSNPAHITLFLRSPIDDDVLDSLARLPGVAGVEGVLQAGARWRADPNAPWRDATLVGRDDFTAQKFDRLELMSGQWPDSRGRQTAAERNTLSSYGVSAPGTVTLLVDDREHTIRIDGVVRDLQAFPPQFGGDASFFASRELIESLFGSRSFNQIKIQIPSFSQAAAEEAAEVVKKRLERIGVSVGFTDIQDPNRHFNQELVDSVILILSVLAVLSLALGLFLVINIINAIVAQQVSQIGVMKAVGAMSSQVVRLYLSGVLIYGWLALLIAVPLGGLAAHALARALLELMNVPLEAFRLSPPAVAQQIGTGLLAPMLAAFWPVVSGARITVREAISTYGIGAGFGQSIFDRLLGRIRGLPRPLALTLRDTFRRKARVALTQITLTTAGVVFIMVLSAGESFTHTIDFVFNTLGLDVSVGFSQPVRIDEVEAIIAAQPGVNRVESWMFRSGTALRNETDPTGERVFLRAVPPDTRAFEPAITQGRWLHPDDGHAIVLNQKLASELGLKAGDKVTLDLDDLGKQEWVIVGSVFDLSARQASAYIPRDTFLREIGLTGRTTVAWVGTTRDDEVSQVAVADRLRSVLEARGIHVGGTFTGGEGRRQNQNQFDILVLLLLVMSALIAVVGSIGLAGTLSINVLERRREIGVMRAIGASSRSVAGLFVGEGLALGLLAWGLSLPLSVPVGYVFAEAIGSLFEFQMLYRFSWTAAGLWLVIIIILSIAASALPALRATRLSVRESLAYE